MTGRARTQMEVIWPSRAGQAPYHCLVWVSQHGGFLCFHYLIKCPPIVLNTICDNKDVLCAVCMGVGYMCSCVCSPIGTHRGVNMCMFVESRGWCQVSYSTYFLWFFFFWGMVSHWICCSLILLDCSGRQVPGVYLFLPKHRAVSSGPHSFADDGQLCKAMEDRKKWGECGWEPHQSCLHGRCEISSLCLVPPRLTETDIHS